MVTSCIQIDISMSKAVKFLWTAFIWGLGLFILLLLMINWGVFGKLPSLAELENPSLLSSSEIYASDGTLMGKYYLKDRTSVPYQTNVFMNIQV
jgi:penicillin-binding protein 1A